MDRIKALLHQLDGYKVGAFFWFAGLFFVTFDKVLAVEVANFTVKIYFFLFAISFVCIIFASLRFGEFIGAVRPANLITFFNQNQFLLPMLILLAYIFFRAPQAEFQTKAIAYSVWMLFDFFVVIALIILARRTTRFLRYLNISLLLGVVFLSIVIITDAIAFGFGFHDGLIGYNQFVQLKESMIDARYHISRPYAFAYEPSYVGMFLAVATSFLFAKMVMCWGYTRKFLMYALITGMGTTAIFLTVSRSSMLCLVLYLSLTLFLMTDRLRDIILHILKFAVPGLVLIFAGVLFFMNPATRDNLLQKYIVESVNVKDGGTYDRLKGNYIAYKIAERTGFLGSGIGSSFSVWPHLFFEEYVIMRRTELVRDKNYDLGGMHRQFKFNIGFNAEDKRKHAVLTIWGEVLAEHGVPGILLFFAFVVLLLLAIYRLHRRNENPIITVSLATAAVYLLFTIHWFPNLPRTDVWVWVAVWCALYNHEMYGGADSLASTHQAANPEPKLI